MATPTAARAVSTSRPQSGRRLHHHHRLRSPPILRSCGRSFSPSLSSSRSARGPARAPRKRLRASASTDRTDRRSRSRAPSGLVRARCALCGHPRQDEPIAVAAQRRAKGARPAAHRRLHVAADTRHHTLRLRCTNEKRGVGAGRRISWPRRASAGDVCARWRVGDRRVCRHRQRVLRRLEDSSVRRLEGDDRSRPLPC